MLRIWTIIISYLIISVPALAIDRNKIVTRSLDQWEAATARHLDMIETSPKHPPPYLRETFETTNKNITPARTPQKPQPPTRRETSAIPQKILTKSSDQGQDPDVSFELKMFGGLREDNLEWTIASDISGTQTPNILSELKWKNLHSYHMETRGYVNWAQNFVAEGILGYSWIFKGKNEDWDYARDNRTVPFSISNNNSDSGNMFDLSGALGYRIKFLPESSSLLWNEVFGVTLWGGYSYHEQNLEMTDGFQTLPATGPLAGLDSRYASDWKGPWLGIEVSATQKKLYGFARLEYHWAEYYAEANWNLRSDFQHPKSFEHEGDDVRGIVIRTGTEWAVNDDWTLNLNLDISDWKMKNGIDRIFFSSGEVAETKLNEVTWDSVVAMLGTTYAFY